MLATIISTTKSSAVISEVRWCVIYGMELIIVAHDDKQGTIHIARIGREDMNAARPG
jgi:hypothetical protein